MTARDHHLRGNGHPAVALALGPDGEGEPAPRPEHAADLGERRRRVALEDVAEAAEDAVDARVGELESARVEHAELDVLDPELAREPPAASTMSGERSLEISRPARPSRGAARKPVSPVPAASSRIVWPGCGSSRSTSHSLTGARRRPEQLAAALPARRHAASPLAVGHQSERSSASSAGDGSQRAGGRVRPHLLGLRRAGDHRADGRLGGETADRDVEQRQAARGRERLERLDPRPLLVGDLEPAREPRPLRLGRAAAVLAGQQAAGEREVRDQRDAEPLAAPGSSSSSAPRSSRM